MTQAERSVPCVYFDKPGRHNTLRTLEVAAARAGDLAIQDILVASATGETGLAAVPHFSGRNLVIVSHSTGFVEPDLQQLTSETRGRLETAGARVLTCQHAFGGVNRAVRRKLNTYQLDEIVAFTLRMFGQGTKVAVEMALMASDAGLVSTRKPCLAIGGTGRGADTAVLLKPAHAQDFFDLRILEFLAKPRLSD